MKAVLEITVHVLATEQFRRIGLVVAEQERPRVFIVRAAYVMGLARLPAAELAGL